VERLLALRPVRWGGAAAVPGLWLTVAWADLRFLALALLCALVTAGVLREIDRRRGPDDDFVL
jgi:hypothetical protein